MSLRFLIQKIIHLMLNYITYVIEIDIYNDIPFKYITTKIVSIISNLWYICLFLKKLETPKAFFLSCSLGNKGTEF